MRLTRRRRRGLTRAAARRAGAERRRRGDVPRWWRRSDHRWHQWRGPAVPEEKGEGEVHATCESRRREDRLTEEAETRRRGGEAVRRPRDGADRLGGELGGNGARSGWRSKTGRKGGEVGGRRLFMAARWRGWRGKTGRGSGVRHRMDGKTGKREGAGAGATGDSSGDQHQPSAGGHGWRRCRATGEGDGARVTWRERLIGGTGDSESWWPAAVCEREWGSTARGADRWARQHSAAWFGFKPIQT
jgi:hypothetical protein